MRANISLLILSHATPFARVINLRIHRRAAYFLLQCLASSTYSSPFPLPDYPRDAQRRGTSLKEFRPHHAYPTHVLLIILEPVDKWAYSGKKIPRRNGVAKERKKSRETSGEELEFLRPVEITRDFFQFVFIYRDSYIEYRCNIFY